MWQIAFVVKWCRILRFHLVCLILFEKFLNFLILFSNILEIVIFIYRRFTTTAIIIFKFVPLIIIRAKIFSPFVHCCLGLPKDYVLNWKTLIFLIFKLGSYKKGFISFKIENINIIQKRIFQLRRTTFLCLLILLLVHFSNKKKFII